MRTLTGLACVSLVALSACGAPTGYYDANGNYVAYTREGSVLSKAPQYPNETRYAPVDRYSGNASVYTNERTFPYNRRGYYDHNGYYITRNNSLNVPLEMFPPNGMCRVWFDGRAYVDQAPVEPCNDIQSRVPAGAYVIYGG